MTTDLVSARPGRRELRRLSAFGAVACGALAIGSAAPALGSALLLGLGLTVLGEAVRQRFLQDGVRHRRAWGTSARSLARG